MVYDNRIENIENRQATYYAIGKDEQKFHEGFINKHNSKLKVRLSKELYAKELLSTEKEKSLKENKAKNLREELIQLKRHELYRQYTSFVTMVPLAAFMAIELTSICSGWVLLSIISGALSYVILPFTALSLVCTLCLIYNNRKIAQKEQGLKSLENGKIAEEGEKSVPYNTDDYVNCADATLTILVVVASIVSEVLEQGIIEDTALLTSNLFGFMASAAFCYNEYKKKEGLEKSEENHNPDEKSEKKTNNISVPKLMLVGSSVLLIKRIMLMSLVSSLSPAVGPALGLVGMICLMAGQVLIMRSYSRELTDVKVSGKGASFGASSIHNTRGYNSEGGGVAI
jgi:hypothetical protein